MTRFTEYQKRITMLLLHKSKTAQDLNNQLDIPYDKLMEELKGLLKEGVVEKEGYPTIYKLKEGLSKELKNYNETSEVDKNKILINALIPAKAFDEISLKKMLGNIKEAIEKDKNVKVYKVKEEIPLKQGEEYSSYLEYMASVKDILSLYRFIFMYSPTSIEVLKPEKMELGIAELQDLLIDILDITQSYNAYLMKFVEREKAESLHRELVDKFINQ